MNEYYFLYITEEMYPDLSLPYDDKVARDEEARERWQDAEDESGGYFKLDVISGHIVITPFSQHELNRTTRKGKRR